MESYSLLMLFGAMVAIWWFTWSPWRKDASDKSPDTDDHPEDQPKS
jgi:hypothetical protein